MELCRRSGFLDEQDGRGRFYEALRVVLTVGLFVVAGWFGGVYLPALFSGEAMPDNPAPEVTGDPHVDDLRHLG